MPKVGGFYLTCSDHPLAHQYNVDLDAYNWPKGSDPARIAGLRQQAIAYRGWLSSLFWRYHRQWILAYRDPFGGLRRLFFTDLALRTPRTEGILDRVPKSNSIFGGQVLDNLGDVVDVVCEQDDLGSQRGPFISPDISEIPPRHRILFLISSEKAPVKLYFHSFGSVLSVHSRSYRGGSRYPQSGSK